MQANCNKDLPWPMIIQTSLRTNTKVTELANYIIVLASQYKFNLFMFTLKSL